MINISAEELTSKLNQITTFIFDVDGVLTDGTVLALESGEQARTFLVKDGFAVEKAVKLGYHVAIISGGNQIGVRKRLEFLGVKELFLGVKDKVKIYQEYLEKHQLSAENVLYMGDDLPDYDIMKLVGLATCPSDATEEIKAISHYISDFGGGKGAVREIIEKVLKLQNNWPLSAQKANA